MMSNSRILLISILIVLFFALLVMKLIDIQLIKGDELSYFAKRQQTNTKTIKAERGFIFDRNNVLLVYNRNDVSFYVDLRMFPTSAKEELAVTFSKTFIKSKDHYLNLVKDSGNTICIEKKAPYDKAKYLMDYNLVGLFYKEEPTRVYHYGRLASHLLGYVNTDYSGVNGIAKSFEDELNGLDGARLIERNAVGEIISVSEDQTKNPLPGDDIYLTIDKNYQSILEDELRKAVKSYSAETATGIIMDPNTGEILALANIGDYNPNTYWSFSDFERKNRAITDVYEPGSTFKVLTLATLLDKQKCYESELVDVESGKYKYRNAYIKDTHSFKKLSVKGIMEESSNIGIAKLVQRLEDETFYEYLRSFGLGTCTSVSLPGEVKGKLHKPAYWSKLTKVYMSFGYGISVTPLQLTTAFCAVINGGVLYQPLIVKKQFNKNTNSVNESSPVIVRRVISEKTSLKMRDILASAVTNGTGNLAKLEKISVGGKTGTSKVIINGKYSDSDYYSTFVGFFPVENPQVVCYVMIKKPKGEYYGGKVSAPVFKQVAEQIIKSDPDKFIKSENFLELKNSGQNITDEHLFINTIDFKKPLLNVDDNKVVKTNKQSLMPDLSGKTVKEALEIANQLNIKYDLIGSGVVVKQSIFPGSVISKDQTCKIYCSDKGINGTRIY